MWRGPWYDGCIEDPFNVCCSVLLRPSVCMEIAVSCRTKKVFFRSRSWTPEKWRRQEKVHAIRKLPPINDGTKWRRKNINNHFTAAAYTASLGAHFSRVPQIRLGNNENKANKLGRGMRKIESENNSWRKRSYVYAHHKTHST